MLYLIWQITLDGRDIRELNIRWLRQQLGVVSQEPVLFEGTIAENVAMGGDGATRDDIVALAKQVNIHEFIMALPKVRQLPVCSIGPTSAELVSVGNATCYPLRVMIPLWEKEVHNSVTGRSRELPLPEP